MAWVKLDDHFPDHPKVVSAGPLGAWLYVAGLCYCNRLLTDGFIPWSQVDRLAPHRDDQDLRDSPTKLALKLCGLGLWIETERKGVAGFIVHDYRKYQPSRKQVLKERRLNRGRQTRFRNGKSNGVTNSVNNDGPVPVPVPVKERTNTRAAATPRLPVENVRVITALVHAVLQTSESNDYTDLKEETKRQCALAHIAYDGDVVGRALESALAQRRMN